jgi:hypothetical protein
MKSDVRQSIVIVDRSRIYGVALSASLKNCEVCTHVFHNFSATLALLRSKKIDTVVVEFDGDAETRRFCDEAKALDVAVVFIPTAFKLKIQDHTAFGLQENPQAYTETRWSQSA